MEIKNEFVISATLLLFLFKTSQGFNFSNVPGCQLTSPSGDLSISCQDVNLKEVLQIIPSETVSLAIKDCFQRTVDYPMFSRFANLRHLSLSECYLIFLKPGAFRGLRNLQTLDLHTNILWKLEPETFKETPRLRTLDLTFNAFSTVKNATEGIIPLLHLKTLILDSNVIESVGDDDFVGLPNNTLKKFYCRICRISHVSSEAFTPLGDLEILDLSNNKLDEFSLNNLANSLKGGKLRSLILRRQMALTSYPVMIFNILSNSSVENIDLSMNYISTVIPTNHLFEGLKDLNLERCVIKFVDSKAFDNFPNLETLNLKLNSIISFPFLAIHVPRLKYLDLSYATDVRVPSYIKDYDFINFGSLETLNLHNLPLTERISRNMFKNLTTLKNLDISAGSIAEIEPFSFESLTSLQKLLLQGNKVQFIKRNTFAGLVNLLYLNLDNNLISFNAPDCQLDRLPRLNILSLSYNLIGEFPDCGEALPSLLFLRLTGNAITPWERRWSFSSKLEDVSLDQNTISHVTPGMLQDFSTLRILDLSFNPFECQGCNMHRFLEWIRSNRTTMILWDDQNRKKAYACDRPDDLKGKHLKEIILTEEVCLRKRSISLLTVLIPILIILLVSFLSVILACRYKNYLKYYSLLLRTSFKKYKEAHEKDNFTFDAFVSFSSSDIEWIQGYLIPHLEKDRGFKLCLPERNIEPGLLINEVALKALNLSRKKLVILSQHYLDSAGCIAEFNLVEDHVLSKKNNSLILVKIGQLEVSKMPKSMIYLVETRTYIEWSQEQPIAQKLFWERLSRALMKPLKGYELKQVI